MQLWYVRPITRTNSVTHQYTPKYFTCTEIDVATTVESMVTQVTAEQTLATARPLPEEPTAKNTETELKKPLARIRKDSQANEINESIKMLLTNKMIFIWQKKL